MFYFFISIFIFIFSFLLFSIFIKEIMKETEIKEIKKNMYFYLVLALVISLFSRYYSCAMISFFFLLFSYLYVTIFEMLYTFPDLMKYTNSLLYKKLVLILFLIFPVISIFYGFLNNIYCDFFYKENIYYILEKQDKINYNYFNNEKVLNLPIEYLNKFDEKASKQRYTLYVENKYVEEFNGKFNNITYTIKDEEKKMIVAFKQIREPKSFYSRRLSSNAEKQFLEVVFQTKK